MQALSFFAALTGSLPRQGGGDATAPDAGVFSATLDAAVHETHGLGHQGSRAGFATESQGTETEAATPSETDAALEGLSLGLFQDLQVVETATGWGFAFQGSDGLAGSAMAGSATGGSATGDSTTGVSAAQGMAGPAGSELEAATPPAGQVSSGDPSPGGSLWGAGDRLSAVSVPGDAADEVAASVVTNVGEGADPVVTDPSVRAANGTPSAPAPVTSSPATEALPFLEGADEVAATTGVAAVDEMANVATDPSPDPDRDLRKLEPELLTRLQRVVDRMYAEHGHRVELVEGYRSQDRQNFLFAQGRQRPGPVVTWTQDSAHTDGRAVDVRIDGGWSDGRAFARLQQIAREEGLVTLGMRDPGHLELADPEAAPPTPAEALRSDMVRPMNTRATEGALTLTGMQFAPVADPAAPARPRPGIAPVAPVARVAPAPRRGGTLSALPGGMTPDGMSAEGSGTAGGVSPGSGQGAERTNPDGLGGRQRQSTSGQAGSGTADPGTRGTTPAPPVQTPRSEGATDRMALSDLEAVGRGLEEGRTVDPTTTVDAAAASGAEAETEGPDGIGTPGGISQSGAVSRAGAARGVQASSVMQRLEQVMALQDKAAAEGPGWRVTMPDADGEGTRVQVGLRGQAVGARVDMNDPATAAFMRSRAAELTQALETRGLDAEQLFVRSAGEARDAALASRSGGMNLESLRNLAAELTGSGSAFREGEQDSQRENAQRNPQRGSETDAWSFEDSRSSRDENSQQEDDK